MKTNTFIMNLTSEDPDRLRAFYRDVVGLEALPDMGPGAFSVTPGAVLAIGDHEDTHGMTKEPHRVLIDFMVDDVRVEQDRLSHTGLSSSAKRARRNGAASSPLSSTPTVTSASSSSGTSRRVATWREFAGGEPGMAQVLRTLLDDGPIAYLATVRKDGSPRVHPFCPVIADGRMYIAINETSPKRFDLKNDGRYAMHAMPGKWREGENGKIGDDEFYATGRARFADSAAEREAISAAAGHTIHTSDWLFELGLDYVMTAYWEKVGQPGTYAVRNEWRAA